MGKVAGRTGGIPCRGALDTGLELTATGKVYAYGCGDVWVVGEDAGDVGDVGSISDSREGFSLVELTRRTRGRDLLGFLGVAINVE
jgi:hypothetical protein